MRKSDYIMENKIKDWIKQKRNHIKISFEKYTHTLQKTTFLK